MKRLEDDYYSTIKWLNVLTDEEYNELICIEGFFSILNESLPHSLDLTLSKSVMNGIREINSCSARLIDLAIYRLDRIISLCKNGN